MTTLLIVIIALALIFDYINGFHDAANSIATVVSTKVLSPFQAVVWAAFFNFVAFFIFKDHGVANTIAKTVHEADITLEVILAGLIAAIAWNLLTWWFGIPSSSSHTLIGGFAGAAIAHAGFGAIEVGTIAKIASFIVLAPLLGMLMAFIISLWFLNSFRKTIYPKIFSLLVILVTVYFVHSAFETNMPKIMGFNKIEITDKGLLIQEIPNKTPAKAMGLIKGDILIAINGQALPNTSELDQILSTSKSGDQISFTIIRNDQSQEVKSTFQPRFESRTLNYLGFGENVKWLIIGFILISIALFSLFLSMMNYTQSERWFKR
ncbi:MAG TPA: inorganic phosphate transporter, partial [Algoriphagus sp.]|nr:inorganic phosphate transporter [Algoriphagus sp.]